MSRIDAMRVRWHRARMASAHKRVNFHRRAETRHRGAIRAIEAKNPEG